MYWNPIQRVISKTTHVINAVMSKSELCKVDNCFKEAWQDGYCHACAHYFLMKEAVSAIREHNELIVGVAKQHATGPVAPNRLTAKEAHRESADTNRQPAFIPQIDINEKANITNVKKTIAQKDVRKLSKLLQETKNSEVKFK